MKRVIAAVLCILMTLSLLPGCQNDVDSYVPTGDALVMDDGQLANEPDGPEEVQNLRLTYYPKVTLNPIACTDLTNRALFSLLFQGLFAVDRNYNPAPILCKEYTVSKDMKTYTFYLENATFSDGTAVTAADVVASYQAAKGSTYYAGRFLQIRKFSAGEDGSVVFTLKTPMENLPILLDIPIIKASEVKADRPLGTGPYYFDENSGTAVLRQCNDWWCEAQLPVSAPAISLTEATSITQIRDNFEFNGLNLVCANPGSDRYTDYRCDYELWDSESGVFLYMTCNLAGAIFSNTEVRSALTYAIDRDSIAADNYRGFARSASLPASPNSPYYSQVQAAKYAYDGGERFKKAVADNGMTGKTLSILVNSDDTMRVRIARSIGDTMRQAGFVVNMKELSGNSYRYTLNVREYDLLVGQTRLSANMDLSPFFASGGALSYGSIADTGMYALCAESLANQGNYYSLHQAVMDDGRLCPILFSSYAVYATRGLMTDLAPSRDNIFYYSLDKTMESALKK